ncbi:AMP-binding protein [Salinirubellus salinus]|uniref:AMP-binding protein n=1 Tax=Salinirubellus salinus TaxID=1364945 RepID=A0A9E7R0D7_9EURY|nr:AMP-binding protein [Salinirubellus salinus]UWM53248.1 AMP-binding protein [Salinirubellus salinus]
MTYHVTLDGETYEDARESFEWDVPDDYNAAHDLVGKHDDPKARIALFQAYPDGRRETYTFHDLDRLSDRVAAGLAALGVEEGDRVGVVLPQKPANPLTHLACWKLGAVSIPLSVLFGPDGLSYRLDDADAKVAVVDEAVLGAVDEAREACPALEHVVAVDADEGAGDHPFTSLREHDGSYDRAETGPDTPATVLYTSGSTGPPKGVLHGHALWLGHCPAFQMYFERDLSASVCWTPADWAWIGALGDLLFPAWHYGRPVLGYPMAGFDSGTAYSLLAEFGVTDAFLPPTAIRMLMDVDRPTERYDLDLKAVCSGGEPLTPEILDWAADELDGVAVNELYGQTEANLLVTNCRQWFPAQAGSMGKPVPGHDVAVVDPETGAVRETGEVGEIAVSRGDDPVVFQEYLNKPEKTAAARLEAADGRGDWHLTGDLGRQDEDGYLWFKARDDDLIVTAGYRVGPGEVESAILEHPKVEQVGVVGVPDETRGEVIKAVVQPVAGVPGDDALREELKQLVRDRLAKHEYPRLVEFRETLPQTTTGKIKRRELR